MCQVNVEKQKAQLHWVATMSTAIAKNMAHLRTRVSKSEAKTKACRKAVMIVSSWEHGVLSIEHYLSELGCMLAHIVAYDHAEELCDFPAVIAAIEIYTVTMGCDVISSTDIITTCNFSDLFHRVNRHFLEG